MQSRTNEALDWKQAVFLTEEIVKFDSSSPEGKRKILKYVEDLLKELHVEIIQPNGAEPYLIAKISSGLAQPSFKLILEGHLDTVPPGTMKNPFQPILTEGRLYGRGTADMKAGCAAMIIAVKEFAKLNSINGEIYLVLVADEETSSKSIIEALGSRLPKADLAVIAEPTELALGIAHKGIEWFEVSFQGKPGHASVPELGINAIVMASRFIQTLEQHIEENFRRRRHDVCGLPTMTIGSIRGGEKYPNIVPELCELRIDRRWNPNETIEMVWGDMENCLQRCTEKYSDFQATWKRIGAEPAQIFPPLDFSTKSSVFATVSNSFKQVIGDVKSKGLSYWTEGSLLQMYGTPAVVFGPGSIDQAHSAEEFVKVEQIIKAAECYFSLLAATCL